MDDNSIIELFWKRIETAIEEVSKKYAKYCYSISFRILYNAEDADECVNDTFLRTWNAIPPARPNRLSTFLGKITRNLSLDRYEKMNAEKRGGSQTEIALSELEECMPSILNVEKAVEDNALTAAIDGFLSTLPTDTRKVFMRRYWHLCSIKEISTAYRISESKTTSILFRTRKKLKDYLEKEGIMV